MPFYVVAQLNIHDRTRYARYESGFMEIFAKYGGSVLSVDEAAKVLEGDWNYMRTVLLEFPSEEQAMAWYRAEPIAAFGGRTAESLVKEGKAAAVRDFLDHIATGGFA